MCELAELELLVCVGAAGVDTESDYTDSDLQLQTFSYSRKREKRNFHSRFRENIFTHLFQTQGQNREAATIKQLSETKSIGFKTPRAPSASASLVTRES